jgi:hypothetical protein
MIALIILSVCEITLKRKLSIFRTICFYDLYEHLTDYKTGVLVKIFKNLNYNNINQKYANLVIIITLIIRCRIVYL